MPLLSTGAIKVRYSNLVPNQQLGVVSSFTTAHSRTFGKDSRFEIARNTAAPLASRWKVVRRNALTYSKLRRLFNTARERDTRNQSWPFQVDIRLEMSDRERTILAGFRLDSELRNDLTSTACRERLAKE